MTRSRSFPRAALASLIALPLAALAHHGWTGYNEELLKLTGTIEASSYASPHGSATLKTPDKTWTVVLAPPSRMQNRGLTEEMLEPGTSASVEGYVHRTNESELRAERITIDGKTVELR